LPKRGAIDTASSAVIAGHSGSTGLISRCTITPLLKMKINHRLRHIANSTTMIIVVWERGFQTINVR